ncbi:MAG: hypothetical protein V1840_03340 [Candidatus Omnitrophota bacterium]
MDTLTFVIGIISAAIISGVLVVLFGDQIIRKKLPETAPDPLADPQAIEKLREECELFKKDSFSARLEVQNLNKELAAQHSAYNILSCEHQALKGQLRKALEQKCEDFGFHKIAFEKLSEEHELMRRYLEDLQELHKGDQTAVEELKKKLDSTTEALRAEEQVQEDTVKLEELLEKQLAIQKKRAADLLELEKENKAIKEQLETFQHEKQHEN